MSIDAGVAGPVERLFPVWGGASERLRFLLRDESDTLAQAALRFCLSHLAVTTVVTGMRKPDHARENVAASDRGPLPDSDLAALEEQAWPHNFWA